MSMGRFFRYRILALVAVALTTSGLDQFSKYWLLNTFGMATRPPVVLCDYFSLVMVWNHGISFGILSNTGQDETAYVLVAIAIAVSALLAHLALRSPHRWERVAYGMVIGGALGNAIDRLRLGAVADFLYVHVGELGWPAFNIADAAICIAVGILLLHQLRTSKVAA